MSDPAARTAANYNKGGQNLKNAARRDPAVFPLALIMGTVFLGAGYFLTGKGWYSNTAEKHFAPAVHPWEAKDGEEHDRIKDKISAFKYKYRDAEGNLVDAPTASQREVYPVKEHPARLHAKFPHDGSDN
ncbi:hypothetical protein BT69DRAFT_1286749 [Atractiella rhizophila]|nr:hypothetical protein BT69DRAFT_1286749 [Atractiella rhizophila]